MTQEFWSPFCSERSRVPGQTLILNSKAELSLLFLFDLLVFEIHQSLVFLCRIESGCSDPVNLVLLT